MHTPRSSSAPATLVGLGVLTCSVCSISRADRPDVARVHGGALRRPCV